MIGLRIRTLLGGMLLAGGLVSGSWADSAPEAFSQQRLDAFGAAMAEEVQQGRIAGIAGRGRRIRHGRYDNGRRIQKPAARVLDHLCDRRSGRIGIFKQQPRAVAEFQERVEQAASSAG